MATLYVNELNGANITQPEFFPTTALVVEPARLLASHSS